MEIKPKEQSDAKKIVQCDYCKSTLSNDAKDKEEQFQATLTNSKGEKQQYEFCHEQCLSSYLNMRSKKRKNKSKASLKEINLGNCKIFI